MARIRSIKPETPQSETIGSLSRDARLLFIQLWTIVDDEGRARAASRMLASLLYPYDDDVPMLIDGWLDELESKGCIRRYEVDGSKYLEVVNWLKHQKIDKPTKSRLPGFSGNSDSPREPSRMLATDLGPRIKDLGSEREIDEREPVSREAIVIQEAIDLSNSILKANGGDREDPAWCGFPYTVQCWLNQKIPKDFIIAKCAGLRGKNKNYLDKAVQNSWREKQSEPQTPRKTNGSASGNIIPAQDRILKKLAEFGSPIGASRIRSEEGEANVRLLSKG